MAKRGTSAEGVSTLIKEFEDASVFLLLLGNGDTAWSFEESACPIKKTLGRTCGLVCVEDIPGKGRGVFLNCNQDRLSAGTVLFEAKAAGAVVARAHQTRLCHRCFTPSPKMFRCADCESVLYCSKDCLSLHSPVHDQLCNALGVLRRLNLEDGRVQDVDAICLALHLLQKRNSPGVHETDFRMVDTLATHWERVDRKEAEESAQLIHTYLVPYLEFPLPSCQTVEKTAQLLLSIRFNAHPLELHGMSGAVLGLFPSAALLNHSCCPEVITFARSCEDEVHVVVKSVVEVFPGMEVNCSYISELCSPRQDRQALLKEGFMFDCSCKRCSQPGPEFPVDALVCCQCGTLLEVEFCQQEGCLAALHKIKPPTEYIGLLKQKLEENVLELAKNTSVPLLSQSFQFAQKILNCSIDAANWLHPGHSIRHNAAMLCLTIAKKLANHEEIAKCAEALADCWTHCLGHTLFPQIGAMKVLAGNAYSKLFVEALAATPNTKWKSPEEAESLRQRALSAYFQAVEIYGFCHGQASQHCVKIKQSMSYLSKNTL